MDSVSSPEPSTVLPVEEDSSSGVDGLSLNIRSSASIVVSVFASPSKSNPSEVGSSSDKLSVTSSIPSSSHSSSSSSIGLSVLVRRQDLILSTSFGITFF